ncbi:MAG: Vacuolar morphogenesis protein 6 [Peltula sp. TS41687]|nr:MAG: Vacuolar morphogenesis protein 6 [Peltula sp. TS41687]
MLSAFAPQPLVELKQRDKSKIESILTYENKLLVGLNTGTLRVYRINEDGATSEGDVETSSSSARPASAELLREIEKFSRRAIEQLAVIKEANILISLSDGYVSIHNLRSPDYELQEQLSKTKGTSVFAVTSNIFEDLSTGIPSIVSRLAVAVKRKVLFWSWQDTELSSSATEVTLTAPARTLTWASGTKILCGLNSGYVLVDVQTQAISDILSPGSLWASAAQDEARFGAIGAAGMGYVGMGSWVPKPLATKLTDGEMLLAKDVNTLFIDQDGKALDRRQIQWSTAPEAISFSYPYLLALQTPSKGLLEVRNPRTQSLLQSISLPNASRLHMPQANVSLAHSGKFLVASARCIWRMTAENYESQIDQLLEKGQLDEAISVLDMLEDALLDDREARLREVKMQKAELLFRNRRYRVSLDLFTEVAAPPERVIRLYPSVVAGPLAQKDTRIEEQAQSEFKVPKIDGTLESGHSMRPDQSDVASQGKSKAKTETRSGTPVGRAEAVDNSDTASILGRRSDSIHEASILEGKDLQVAIRELYAFLADTRRRLQNHLGTDGSLKEHVRTACAEQSGYTRSILKTFLVNPEDKADTDITQELRDTAKLVDTTLFRAYMVERPALAGSLFRIPNFCDPDVVNEKLLETGRYEDLVDFFHGKHLDRPALELLRRFGQARDVEDVPPALRGPRKTVSYLQNLPPKMIDLILEFAKWPLLEDPELGMDVFLADTENAENLPRERVLSFLQDVNPEFAVRYLEHLIEELNDMTPDFHQRLVGLYFEKLKAGDAHKRPGKWIFKNDFERRQWIDRMQQLLRSSNQYSTGKTFNLLPKDDPEFYEARAIVLSKMGNHKQALEIYVFKLKDQGKAEEYCNQVHLNQDTQVPATQSIPTRIPEESPKSIYQILLSLYLRPPSPYQPDWDSALNILSKHGSRLPASSTLELMPPSFPIKDLESYFRSRLRTGTAAVNEARVLQGLCASENQRYRAMVLLGDDQPGSNAAGRNRKVVISDERVCRVCHKRLGRSVISVFPE